MFQIRQGIQNLIANNLRSKKWSLLLETKDMILIDDCEKGLVYGTEKYRTKFTKRELIQRWVTALIRKLF